MIEFLKLTPDACHRMWLKVRFESMKKHGKSLRYQINLRWMKKERELRKQAACMGEA